MPSVQPCPTALQKESQTCTRPPPETFQISCAPWNFNRTFSELASRTDITPKCIHGEANANMKLLAYSTSTGGVMPLTETAPVDKSGSEYSEVIMSYLLIIIFWQL